MMEPPTVKTRRASYRRGVAATEFGLILPLMITLLLGAVDFGRFAHRYIAVTNGARAGAGFAIMNPFTAATQGVWNTKLQQAVLDEVQQVIDEAKSPTLSASDLQVTATRTLEPGGMWRVTVTASLPFQTIVPWPGLPNQFPLQKKVVMRGIR